jgi:hypothetical protein
VSWFEASDYWLSRLVFERSLAVIYLIAFLVAAHQFRALLGEHGLLPAPRFLAAATWTQSPSLFFIRYSDRLLTAVAWTGIVLSAAMVAGIPQGGPAWASMLAWFVLWALYLSIVNVGQIFYAFGWETLLLEAGFLAIFLGPDWISPPVTVMWLIRWLLFRLEFGAGLIKIRGDQCWRDLTCLYYHHETQPMPNPLSWYFHHLPKALHRVEVVGNHAGQLVIPFLLFAPQPVAAAAGLAVLIHQTWLLLSGNFSWLNVLTLTFAFATFDDSQLGTVIRLQHGPQAAPPLWFIVLALAYTTLVAVLSYRPIRNMISSRQRMNASFEPFHLVNTYGAFGSITRQRYEIAMEGTDERELSAETQWQEYGFKGKPDDPRRMPPQVAPYHLRLDWLMWFAAMSPAWAHPWIISLAEKLLLNDRAVLKLLRHNPFPSNPPAYVRAQLYRYRFSTWRERRETGAWWVRTPAGEYLPPLRLSSAGQHDRAG